MKGYRMPRPGSRWRHYKGNEYIVKGLTMHSETMEYMVLYEDEKGTSWVRPLSMWEEMIEKPNYKGPRFMLIDEVYHGAFKSVFRESSDKKKFSFRRKV